MLKKVSNILLILFLLIFLLGNIGITLKSSFCNLCDNIHKFDISIIENNYNNDATDYVNLCQCKKHCQIKHEHNKENDLNHKDKKVFKLKDYNPSKIIDISTFYSFIKVIAINTSDFLINIKNYNYINAKEGPPLIAYTSKTISTILCTFIL